jgi:hypothetical protein
MRREADCYAERKPLVSWPKMVPICVIVVALVYFQRQVAL